MTHHMLKKSVYACTSFVPFVDIAIRRLLIIPATTKKSSQQHRLRGILCVCVHTNNEKNTSMRIVERMNNGTYVLSYLILKRTNQTMYD